MNRGLLTSAGLGLALLLVLSVNVVAENMLRQARVDLTEDRLFTLSQGTRNVLASLKEPITLHFYYSQKLANGLPQIKRYGERVREMVEEYAAVADGMIRLQIVDPEPFTEAEDVAVRNGLQAMPVTLNDSIYFGLVGTNAVDDREVIKFFSEDKEPFLEYELTRLVHNLSQPEKPVVGLLTAHQMNADVSPMLRMGGQGPQQWAIVPRLEESFELKTIYPEEEKLPENIDVLLIVHPGKLSDAMLYAIDQYVMAGGRAVVAVDPFSEVAQAFQQPGPGGRTLAIDDHSDLPRLLDAWGVLVEDGKIVGDWQLGRQVSVGIPGKVKIVRYLSWMALGPDNFNHDDVILGGLGAINVASAGSILPAEAASTTLTPLIATTAESGLFEADMLRYGPNPENLLRNFKPDERLHVVAARVTGPAKSAFPDGPPKPLAAEGEEGGADADKTAGGGAAGGTAAAVPAAAKPEAGDAAPAAAKEAAPARPHLAESAKDLNVVVFSDTDFLFDQFWVSQQQFLGQTQFVATASNGDLLVNALDHLSGSADLIGLRSRGRSERRFEVMSDLRRAAERAYLDEERELAEKLEATQKRLTELQTTAAAGGGALLSEVQEAEIEKARQEILATRKALRDVQHSLNKDIDQLETRLKFANIGLIPLLIGLVALVLAAVRFQRRRAASRSPG